MIWRINYEIANGVSDKFTYLVYVGTKKVPPASIHILQQNSWLKKIFKNTIQDVSCILKQFETEDVTVHGESHSESKECYFKPPLTKSKSCYSQLVPMGLRKSKSVTKVYDPTKCDVVGPWSVFTYPDYQGYNCQYC